MLLRQCDSCEEQVLVGDAERIPASWARITVEFKTMSKVYVICRQCFEMPMTFGKVTKINQIVKGISA